MAKEKPRMVGNYEVINSIHIGDKEVVLGENKNDPKGCMYMTCFATRNELLELCTDVLVSSNFLEIAEIYSDRLREQIAQAKEKNLYGKVITKDMCDNTIWTENLIGKILVVNADYLRPEYRNEKTQIILCKGGNGAQPRGMGMSIFGQECFSEEKCQYQRGEIVGELKREFYPEWLVEKLAIIEEIKSTPNIFAYNGKHFVGIGYLPKNYDEKTTLHNNHNPDMRAYNDGAYDYNKFYKASQNSYYDIFKCVEDKQNYLPGQNELFRYSGEVEKEKPQPKEQTKKKSERQVER